MVKKGVLLILACIVCSVMNVWAQQTNYNRAQTTVTLHEKNISAEELFMKIHDLTTLDFIYNQKDLQSLGNVSIDVDKAPVLSVLHQLFDDKGIQFKIANNSIIIEKSVLPFRGKVYDDKTREPIIGASVWVKEAKYGIATDNNGEFTLSVSPGNTIVISSLGYESVTKKIKVTRDKRTDFFLTPNSHNLNEVVVTGIFNKPKVSFTGAATTITKDQIEASGNRNLLKTIASIDPSFHLMENNSKGSDPNQTLYFQMRGASSINSDINNLQTDISNERNMPLFILDGFEVTSERVMDLNQSDVESVVLLKDASATAIYGSRGANGVVVITSAHPAAGKLRVSYSVGLNTEIPDLSSYKLLNSFQKLDIEKEAGLYKGNTLSDQLRLDGIYNTNLTAANEGVNTDWIHKPVQVGLGQYHKLDFTGGTDQFRYILNASYNQLEGAMKGSKRNNLNGNMTISYLMKKVRMTNTLSIGVNNSRQSNYGSFSDYVNMNPYWRPYDDTGEPIMGFYAIDSNYQTANPLYDAAQTSFSKSNYTNIRNSTMVDMDIFKNVRINLNLGITTQHQEDDDFTSPKSTRYTIEQTSFALNDRGEYIKQYEEMNMFQLGGTVSWAKVYGGHSLYLGANAQMMETNTRSTGINVKGFINDEMNDISDANSYEGTRPSSSEATTRSIGFTGTFNYNYESRYFFDASYRADGSSSFGSQSRWAPFWSVGAGWDLANEPFIQKLIPSMSTFKIRYSYGVTGSLNFSPYDALTTYEYDQQNQYNGLIGASIIAYGNPNLKWQTTKQHNIGLDWLMFNQRLSVTLNYYRKTTDNLLSEVGLPISHGYDSYKENLGVIRNVGYDLAASYTLLRNNEKQINWTVRAGITHNSNVIVKLSDAIKKQMEQFETSTASGSSYYQYREGYSTNDLWVYKSIGVDPETGKRLYVDQNGTVTTNYAVCRKVSVGSALPTIDTRFGTSFRWKGLMLDLGFAYRYGAKMINRTLMDKIENAQLYYNVDPRVVQYRWKKPGDITAYKDIASTANTPDNTSFVFTESTFTFNSLNLTYEFPKKWIRKLKMERLALTASMSDILYISNIDEERGTSYPYTIKPMFSLACTF
jgi:TonB-linked SusC/RagA family outer membrane protein